MRKALLARDLIGQRDALLALCDALSDAARVFPLAGGEWSVAALVGHLSYWEQQTLGHIRDTLNKGRPEPMPPDSLDDDLNARAAAHRAGWPWSRIRGEFYDTRSALANRVLGLDESTLAFYIPSPWVGDSRIITLETLIRKDVLVHAQTHLDEIQMRLVSDHAPAQLENVHHASE